MTDSRADTTLPLTEGDRLPWLEAVEEEGKSDGPSAAKMIAFVIIGLAAIGLIVGGLFWMGNRSGAGGGEGGDPELIAAAEGPYKVKPDDPGGMKVEGEGDTAFAASAGADPKGAINTNAVAERPVTEAPKAAPPPAAAPKQGAAAPAQPAQAPAAASGPAVQLGAFSSAAGAETAWKALAGRFRYLAPLNHSVSPVTVGGKTLYRLRASGPDSAGICGRLRVAGESCESVN